MTSYSKLLSIIIPVYKVEDYIRKCIVSLQEQDLASEEYEVIVINDGSPDNCKSIILSLCEIYPNIVFIDQENAGVSVARNRGLDIAQGRFILFVDPDDYLDANCLSYLLEQAEVHNTDILMFGLKEVQYNGQITLINTEVLPSGPINGIELYHNYRKVRGESAVDAVYGMIIRTSTIENNELRFIKDVPYLEDGELIARLVTLSNNCLYLNKPFYNRLVRPGSAMNSKLFYSKQALNGFILGAQSLQNFQKKNVLTNEQKEFLNQPISKFVLLVLIPLCTFSTFGKFFKQRRELTSLGYGKLDLKGCNNYYKIEGFFYNYFPLLLFFHRVIGVPLFKLIKP